MLPLMSMQLCLSTSFAALTGMGSFECDDALVPDTVTHTRSIRELYVDALCSNPLLYFIPFVVTHNWSESEL